MNRRGRAVAAALLAATATLGVIGAPGAAVAAPATAPVAVAGRHTEQQARAWLPQPAGPYPIGTTSLQLTDDHRDDPWKPGQHRKLMISLWYPTTRPATGNDRAPYMLPTAADHFGSADSVAQSENPDGTGVHPPLPTVAEDGLTRPFLLMGTQESDSGSYHQQPGSYTDAQSLLPQLARQGAISSEALTRDVGDVHPDRAVLATRSYVASFLDRWLRDHDDHLLDGPSPRFPEMVYER